MIHVTSLINQLVVAAILQLILDLPKPGRTHWQAYLKLLLPLLWTRKISSKSVALILVIGVYFSPSLLKHFILPSAEVNFPKYYSFSFLVFSSSVLVPPLDIFRRKKIVIIVILLNVLICSYQFFVVIV